MNHTLIVDVFIQNDADHAVFVAECAALGIEAKRGTSPNVGGGEEYHLTGPRGELQSWADNNGFEAEQLEWMPCICSTGKGNAVQRHGH